MMWRVSLIFFLYVAAQVTSQETKVECRESLDFPPRNDNSPSLLADLKAELVPMGSKYMINVSWAINIDASIEYLIGTRIKGIVSVYFCEYNPPLAKTNLTGSKQKWFHHLVSGFTGPNEIGAVNLPVPPHGSGPSYKYTDIEIPDTPQRMTHQTPSSTQVTTVKITTEIPTSEPKTPFTSIVVAAIFGGLAGLMILTTCIIFLFCNSQDKSCGTNFATSLSFERLSTCPMVPVSVLVVYPAENVAFQRAVVALAEFLQWHSGCSVAIDMWQQGRIAELGPMRWLAEQVKAAERVLIVCPQPSSQPSHSPPSHSSPEPTIPAAAHDLYPLILNMVASHAKSAIELARFWVVQLGEQKDKRPSNLPLELGSCKSFCLMKDLNKLCESLYTQRQDDKKKTSDLILRPRISYSEKSTVKLRETVEKLSGHQPSIHGEAEPLKSVITSG
ncbi:interleukin-17 receptor B isoform X2 [Thunnus thynnus]|uniref:interleukin-17 receptor B isoform X2 n=1 Tax=Thunnus thynnus TaxID=8237 RepID=UPI003528C7CD